MNLVLTLAPGYTVTLQPSTRGGAAVGSPISPTVSGSTYTFNLSALAAGDYDMQLNGNWEQDGPPFALRKTATTIYYADFWWQIDAAIVNGTPVTPNPISGLCNVLVAVTFNGSAVSGALVQCHLEDRNNTVNGFLAARTVETGTTDEDGNCTLTLIQFGEFTRGGVYRLKVFDVDGKILHDRRVTVTNASSANAEDLVDAV